MHIDVFQDTVCPWCYIGKRHMQLALAEWRSTPVSVSYHPFFLNPDIPAEGYPFQQYMLAKGGGQVQLEDWFSAPRRAGAAVGITFNFEAITHAPNTLLSHRLIALTPADQQARLIEALYAAYFTNGENIGDLEVLLRIAEALALPTPDLRAALHSDLGRLEVLEAVQQAQQLGIRGVPFFVFNNTFAFSGAQPPQAFLQAMQQAEMFVSPR